MIRVLLALAVIVLLGIVSRHYPLGWYPYDKSLGDALYAVAVYLGLALTLPRRSPWWIGLAALVFCAAIEAFKFTGIPARYAQTPLRWLLGTTFSWHNLGCYVLGVAAIYAMDQRILRPRRRP
jgi:hypothetical protein